MSNFKLDRPLPTGDTDKLEGEIMKKTVRLWPKTFSYLKDDDDDYKNAKGTKRFVVKRKLKFEDCKNCLKASQIENIIICLERKETDVDCLKEE